MQRASSWFERPPTLVLILSAILCLLLAVLALSRMEGFVRPERGTELAFQTTSQENKAPSAFRAAAFLTGLKIPASHIFWIQTLQYYGDPTNARERYKKLFDYCRLTSDLNPHFLKPYELGTSVLAFQVNRPQEAAELLRRGIEENPGSTRLKVLLAAVGYMNADKYEAILPILEGIIRSGEAPPMMINILANTYQKVGRWDDAVRVWRWILSHSTKAEEKELAVRALEKLYQTRRGLGTSRKVGGL
jgi:tetratricopeptide (TPR) repeat protein